MAIGPRILAFLGAAGRLVELYLSRFGPATERDIKWWLGSTLTAVRRALAEIKAVSVDLAGSIGFVLPDDTTRVDPLGPWVALLPALDPTVMGWFERDWYLGGYREQLFDSAGNAGPTAWADGRIVGTWKQSESGEVRLYLLEDPGIDARDALQAEAAALTDWFEGTRALPRFPSPIAKSFD